MIKIEGIVRDIRFRNEENFYTVFTLDTDDGPITVVGNIASIALGDHLEVLGNLIYHDLYGEQIALENYQRKMPTTRIQIERYLSSGIFPFIGEKTAKQIVDLYGEQTLSVISEDPNKLLKIRGIGKKRLEKIKAVLVQEQESRDIVIYLQSLGIGNKMAMQIYKAYGKETIDIVSQNPYRLIDDIYGIGFKMADQIALRKGIQKHDLFRISAGVVYYLEMQASSQGNCYIGRDRLLVEVSRLLEIEATYIENALLYIEIHGKIKTITLDGHAVVYASLIYEKEQNIVANIMRLLSYSEDDQASLLELIEPQADFDYSDRQKEAILQAIYKKILIITGGPGTGKTTIIKGIIDLLEKLDYSFYLCAPTGRAAKRMEESTGHIAQTIHRLLGYKSLESEEKLLEYDREKPIPADVIIVDEVSMIDIYLMSDLLDAIDNNSRLILVGDVDQLPSVGPGNILQDFIKSDLMTTITLDTIFRQGEQSNIVKNAHLINKGTPPILNEENQDFFFIRTRNEKETLETILDLVSSRLPDHYKLEPNDIQVLSTMKKGICGIENLNLRLQERLNPPGHHKEEKQIQGRIYREGDKVMQIKNNYDLDMQDEHGNKQKGVFNGDMGLILNIVKETAEIDVLIDGKRVNYKSSNLTELSHAYAITVHKSQGSEFPIVVIPMVSGPYMLLSRNILYTAITRGKQIVVLVGDQRVMQQMIDNNYRAERNSSLSYYLKKTYDFYSHEDT